MKTELQLVTWRIPNCKTDATLPFRWLILTTPCWRMFRPPGPPSFSWNFHPLSFHQVTRLYTAIHIYTEANMMPWRTVQCEITQVSLQGHHASAFVTPPSWPGWYVRILSFYFTVSPILGVCFSVGGCSFEFEQSFDPRPLFFLDRHTEEPVAVVLLVPMWCFSCGSRTIPERK